MSSSLSDVLLEFLEAATHCLIYARGVYPKAIFDRRTIYGLVVHWSRHPEVNKYIQDVLSQTKPLLESGCVSDVAVLFTKSTDNTVIERVVFHIGQAYKPPQHSVKAAASETDEKADDVADSVKALRSALLCLMRASPPEKAKAAAEHGKLLFEMQVRVEDVDLREYTRSGAWAPVHHKRPAATNPGVLAPINTACLPFCTLNINSERPQEV